MPDRAKQWKAAVPRFSWFFRRFPFAHKKLETRCPGKWADSIQPVSGPARSRMPIIPKLPHSPAMRRWIAVNRDKACTFERV